MKPFITMLLLLIHSSAWACINKVYPKDLAGMRAEHQAAEKQFMTDINQAVDLIIQGELIQAIEQLHAVEKALPGRYETAANLGTAYELRGQIAEAMHWIKRGIEINPNAHDGTEWLHYAILRAKDEVAKDATWLTKHSVIEADYKDQDRAIKALNYQLAERTQLVKPPNDIVADLYYLLGLMYDRNGNDFLRDKAFRDSLRYGDLRQEAIRKEKRNNQIRLEPIIR